MSVRLWWNFLISKWWTEARFFGHNSTTDYSFLRDMLTSAKPKYQVSKIQYDGLHLNKSIIQPFLCQNTKLWFWSNYNYQSFDKKAVLSQRWARDARSISRSWAVEEIWPFEIIQDGGGRHLEFIRIENSAIRSAVPDNPTLEQNMKWIGRPVAEISPLEIFSRWLWPPSWICSNRK